MAKKEGSGQVHAGPVKKKATTPPKKQGGHRRNEEKVERTPSGHRFFRARKAAGLTITQAHKRIGATWDTVNRWEIGLQMPGRAHLLKAADVYNVSPYYLTGEADEPLHFRLYLERNKPNPPLTDAEREWLRLAPLPPKLQQPAAYAVLLDALRYGTANVAEKDFQPLPEIGAARATKSH